MQTLTPSSRTAPGGLQPLYRTPFSAGYWRAALADFRKLRTLVFSALMIAVCVALSYAPKVVVAPNLEFNWGFLARALCSMAGGPVTALVFGAAEDTISFLLHPTGPYFPGYTLTTMLGNFIYALCLYRAPLALPYRTRVDCGDGTRRAVLVTPLVFPRIALAKLLTNVQNVFLGSLWTYIIYGKKTYWAYMAASGLKNLISFPIQVILLYILFSAMLPVLARVGLIPREQARLGAPR